MRVIGFGSNLVAQRELQGVKKDVSVKTSKRVLGMCYSYNNCVGTLHFGSLVATLA